MRDRLPLPTLLSHVLVAFTIEFDNEAERQLPHRTTRHGSTAGSTEGSLHVPWLVSLAMWENCMRFVGEKGVTVRELEALARTPTNLNGMERWGYVLVEPNPADTRPKPPRRDWVIRATPVGRKAQEIWRPLFGTIEERWKVCFGADEMGRLRDALWTVVGQFNVELPDCHPILGYGLFSRGPDLDQPAAAGRKDDGGSRLPLSALLSRVLLAFAIEFERESDLSLAIGANLLRVLSEKGVRVRELPRLTGVSKELIKGSLGLLAKLRYLVVEPDPTAKAAKLARLTSKGCEAKHAYRERLELIEERWLARFGKGAVCNLRESLERLAGDAAARLDPHPGGWRASVPRPETLPHYPMVTHRGGFPDGS
jgi:DNA-binding MarR family transcriptional regulator